MSKISILINQPVVNNFVLLALRNITQQNLSQINEYITNETPISEVLLFYNDHSEVAGNLLKLVNILQDEKVKFAIYELEEGEVFDAKAHHINEISVQTLENILNIENRKID